MADDSLQQDAEELNPMAEDLSQKNPTKDQDTASAQDDMSPCPYREGTELLVTGRSEPFLDKQIKVQVLHVYLPFTVACVMHVQVMDTIDEQHAVLKLYDRRFAKELRELWGIDEWNAGYEESYAHLLSTDRVADFRQSLRDSTTGSILGIFEEDSNDLKPEEWSLGEDECYVGEWCKHDYDTETKAYNKLRDLQGSVIPRLICEVAIQTQPPCVADPVLAEIPGLLLEYIPGVTLNELAEKTPRESWQSIADSAVSAVNAISDHEILNRDVQLRNIMARPCAASDFGYRAVVIDFGRTRFRGEDESDEDWGQEKSLQDEEGAVGYWLRHKLRKHNFELQYNPSGKYDQWAYRELPNCHRTLPRTSA